MTNGNDKTMNNFRINEVVKDLRTDKVLGFVQWSDDDFTDINGMPNEIPNKYLTAATKPEIVQYMDSKGWGVVFGQTYVKGAAICNGVKFCKNALNEKP